MDLTQDKNILTEQNALIQELRQRNKELEETNAYLENFVHVIAHDMRTPVANLKYLTEVFTSLDEEGRTQYLSLISKSIHKLDNILNGLVQIIDVKGQYTTKIAETIDINEVVEQVLEEQQDVINETGAKVHIKNSFPRKITYIRGYLESILRNLISNALKYRKKNRPTEIYLSVLSQDDFVFISVKDNGIGIDLKKHGKKLFTPFKRCKGGTPGLGIGLHIIKTMVEKNGGRITVESEKGKGATFNIFLKEFGKDNDKKGDDD